MKAHQGVRVPGVVAASLLGLFASVVACGSDAPDEKIGEGLGPSKGKGGSLNIGAGGSATVGVGGGNSTGGSNSIPTTGGTSSGSSGTTGSAGLDGNNACAVSRGAGDKQEVALLFMVDISGSMRCKIPEVDPPCTTDPKQEFDNTRWKEMGPALKDFVASSESDGMWAGISFFGRRGSCNASDYEKPDAEIALLPGAANAIAAAIDKQTPNGTTPTVPSLTGAVTHASAWAKAHANQQVVIVYATDGYPYGCSDDNTIDNAAKVAKDAFDGQYNIRTYVLGVGPNLTDLNKIASNGGTQQAMFIDTTKDVASELATKFNEIRSAVAIDCVYKVPAPPAGQTFDGRVNVSYTSGNGAAEQLGANADGAVCTEGWQFTDTSHSEVRLCGKTCDTVKADSNAKIDVLYGCTTYHVGDPR